MFPSKIAPSLNIADLHPKVTYCFSEGSAVSYHLAFHHSVPFKRVQETVKTICFSKCGFVGPQWHDTVGSGALCEEAGKTCVRAQRQRGSEDELRADGGREEDVREDTRDGCE